MKRAGFIFFLLKGGVLFGQSDTVISKVGTDSIIRIVERDDRIAQILDSTFLGVLF